MAVVTKKAAPTKPQRVSMSTTAFTTGGLIDDIDVEFTDAGTTTFDYQGQAQEAPCLAVEMTDSNGGVHQQYFSCGKLEDWQPDDQNEGFVSLSGKTGINDNSNLGQFLASLVEAGFPDDALADGNLKVITGTKCHVIQKQMERKGIVRQGKNADRPSSVLIVSKIHELPDGIGGATGKPAGKPAGRPAASTAPAPASKAAAGGKANGAARTTAASAAADAGDAIDAQIVEALTGALAEADGNTLPKKDLAKIVFAAFPDAKVRNKAIVRSNNNDFLAGLAEQGIAFDGAKFSLGE